jgi:uncharacterized protein (TIGR02001 family)
MSGAACGGIRHRQPLGSSPWVLSVLSVWSVLPVRSVAAPPDAVGGFVALSSDYLYRAATQTAHDPALQADLHYYAPSGALAGLWASSVRQAGGGPTGAEFDPYLGWGRPLSEDWIGRVSAVRHFYTGGNPPTRYDFSEFSGTLAYASSIFLTLTASPDTLAALDVYRTTRRVALAWDLALHRPLGHAFSANLGLGFYHLHQFEYGGYGYGSAGVDYALGALQFDLSAIVVSGAAHGFYNFDQASNRLIGTVRWIF